MGKTRFKAHNNQEDRCLKTRPASRKKIPTQKELPADAQSGAWGSFPSQVDLLYAWITFTNENRKGVKPAASQACGGIVNFGLGAQSVRMGH
jgi:hypothetical protein